MLNHEDQAYLSPSGAYLTPMDLADRIMYAREVADMGQGELARKVGISASAMSQIECGKTKDMRMEHLFKAARALECDPEWLATGKGIPPSLGVGEKRGHYRIRLDRERLARALEVAEDFPRRQWAKASATDRAELLATLYDAFENASLRDLESNAIVTLIRSSK